MDLFLRIKVNWWEYLSACQLERESNTSKNVVPFFEGVASKEIIQVLYELEPKIDLAVENYE